MFPRDMMNVTGRNTVADLVKAARGDLSMREVARRSGLSAAQISRIESGDVGQPSVETLTRLARALDRSPEALQIATGRLPLATSVLIVAGMLNATAEAESSHDRGSGSSALRGLIEQATRVSELRVEGGEIDAEAAAKLEAIDSWRVDRADAWAEADHLLSEEMHDRGSVDRDSKHRAENAGRWSEARERAERANQELDRAEGELEAVRAKIRDHQHHLDEQERRLEEVVRGHAGQLFIRGVFPGSPIDVPELPVALIQDAQREVGDFRSPAEWHAQYLLSVSAPGVPRAAIDGLAGDLARVEQTWRDARARLLQQPEDRDLRLLAGLWAGLTPDRRQKVLEFAQDQRRLSAHEDLEVTREEVRQRERKPRKRNASP
jgi:transcriptional regulator with XRE-family HTH domain